MGQWSRSELSDAFEQQQAVVAEIGRSWEWSRYADLFTADPAPWVSMATALGIPDALGEMVSGQSVAGGRYARRPISAPRSATPARRGARCPGLVRPARRRRQPGRRQATR